jgi:hypothetical protein
LEQAKRLEDFRGLKEQLLGAELEETRCGTLGNRQQHCGDLLVIIDRAQPAVIFFGKPGIFDAFLS